MNPKHLSTAQSVRFRNRRILVNGKPELVLAGEIHYFRLAPENWSDRLDKLKANGLNTVATYIPWIWHELPDGTYDLTGRTHPQRNLAAFIDLCAERGLRVLVRPGPFNMAELKNEGIPYRLYRDYPDLVPVTWNGARVLTRTLDFLAPDFLAAVDQWFAHVMPVLAQRLCVNGGPIIGVQLCNEIGMLSWVSNSPDLTDVVCEDIRSWAKKRYGSTEASRRVGASVRSPKKWAAALRAPLEPSLELHQVIGHYMRDRYRRYVGRLRTLSQKYGVKGVPFLINIAGTSGGRCETFPLGISQLMETWRGRQQMTAGTDLYLGELTVGNAPALYMSNAFLTATLGRNQPLTSLEFEAGNGNYGDDLGMLVSPEAIQLKTRLSVAQGNRLLNYYLHAGGENPRLESPQMDGTNRLAFTGQRHGYAAPVGPEGQLNATYWGISEVVKTVQAVGDILADSREEHDDIVLGFVPDHYLTEYKYPASDARREQVQDLETFRGGGKGTTLLRALLLNGHSFPAVNLETTEPRAKMLVLATGRTMSSEAQIRVGRFVRNGGKLLLAGLLPDRDHDGNMCHVLRVMLGLRPAGRISEMGAPNYYYPSVAARGWLAPRPEVRVSTMQLLEAAPGVEFETLGEEAWTRRPCIVHVRAGAGEAVVLGCDYPADLDLYRTIMTRLGVEPRWKLDADSPGLIVTSTVSKDGQRLLHLINLAPQAVSLTVNHRKRKMFGGKRIQIAASSGLILPVGVRMDRAVIQESTAEIVELSADTLTVRPTQDEDVIVLKTDRRVYCHCAQIERKGSIVRVTLSVSAHRGEDVDIELT